MWLKTQWSKPVKTTAVLSLRLSLLECLCPLTAAPGKNCKSACNQTRNHESANYRQPHGEGDRRKPLTQVPARRGSYSTVNEWIVPLHSLL